MVKFNLAGLSGLFLIQVMLLSGVAAGEVDFIQEGDSFYQKYEHSRSLEAYFKALEEDPANYEALWKISRAYERMGYNSSLAEAQEENYTKAMEYAEKAAEVNPYGSVARYKLAVSYGRMALFKGGRTKVDLSKRVKEEAEKAIELDPQEHRAYHTLAIWNYEVSNLSWVQRAGAKILYGGLPDASLEKAVEYMQKAIEIAPEFIVHHLELGKIYKEKGEYEPAAAAFRKCMELPPVGEHDGEYKREAEELYKSIEGKIKK
ncbi:MAG: tetratricopeptide repeat protein [Elusimicrobiota bacterium]